jgi:predicted PurR-regulated permease PerM
MSKKPPIVRLPPRSTMDMVMLRSAQCGMIVTGLVALIFALHAGRYVLAPLALAVVIGLMMSPLATRLERRGLPPALSALVVVLVFIAILLAVAAAIATPLSFWADQLPRLWARMRAQISELRGPLETIRSLREQLRDMTGGADVTVALEDSEAVTSVAVLAPAVLAQIILFLAGLYFFVATRYDTRTAILRLCLNRRLRWRVAHIFRDVEWMVSRYLLSITVINSGLAVAVGVSLWLVGVPSPALWGLMAGILNFIVYLGPAIMAAILFFVGLASFQSFSASFVPPLVYLAVNMVEAQFVTPTVIGRTMTLNPFVVFLALAFWLWLWGAVGGLIAVPALLIAYAAARNILPGLDFGLPEPGRAVQTSGRG